MFGYSFSEIDFNAAIQVFEEPLALHDSLTRSAPVPVYLRITLSSSSTITLLDNRLMLSS